MTPLALALLLTLSAPPDLLQRWSERECGADRVCGLGASGERGPFQIKPAVWEGRRCEGDPWNYDDSARCASGYLDNLAGRQLCDDYPVAWGLAAYYDGIGDVLAFQRANGCDLSSLPPHVYRYAAMGIPEPPGSY